MRESEENLKSVHSVGPHDWISRLANRQRRHMCEACKGAEESRQLEHYKTKLPVWPDS